MANRIYNYAATPGNPYAPPPEPNPTAPPPEPKPGVPGGIPPPQPGAQPWNTRGDAEAWFRTRGGHELFNLFKQIYDRNPMAGRAFWSSVVGRGRGENDLQAATIHKMFGGDMDAYNNWLNELHHTGRESQLGNFDLRTGQWNNGGITDPWSWDSVGVGAWNPNYLQMGLQSLPGNDPKTGNPYYMAGADSWKTYSAGQYFDPTQGASYAPPALQAQFAAGQVPGYNQQGQAITTPQPPANTAPTTVNTSATSTSNPYANQTKNNPYTYRAPKGWNLR